MFDIDFAIRRARYANEKIVQRAVERHAQKVWGEAFDLRPEKPARAPPGLPSFHVIHAAPRSVGRRHVYLTCGAAAAGAGREREFFLLARDPSSAHVETLTQVARRHCSKSDGPLAIGDVVDLGTPWTEGAMASRVLVSLPHRRAPRVGSFSLGDRTVRVFWLRPISQLEAGFAHVHGLQSLRHRLDDDSVDVTDPNRPHVV